MIKRRQAAFLKLSFITGVIADFVIAINWLLIAAGYDVPDLMSSFAGTGSDYRFAMYISTMFMFSWVLILAWGSVKPLERKGLLLISASLLTLSAVAELVFYRSVLWGADYVSGLILRILIVTLFSASYIYSLRKPDKG